jgi:imidazolonepropionase-like amidohydrolase
MSRTLKEARRLGSTRRALGASCRLLLALIAAATTANAARAQVVAIVGGTVYPVSGPRIEHGTVLMRDGKIVAVGSDVSVPDGATRIDATGRWVTPGFVNAATDLGLVEVSGVGETRDISARGHDGIAASFAAVEGFNPASPMIPLARASGVTTVVLLPTSGLVAGQAAVVDLAPGTARAVLLRAPAAMVTRVGHPEPDVGTARGELLGRLRELFDDVLAFDRQRDAYDRGDMRSLSASRRDLVALVPVVRGHELLIVQADRASDIENALELSREYRLRIAIAGGAEAWKVASALAAARVPVLTGALGNIPESFSTLDVRRDNAALLARAGVTVVLIGNSGIEDQSQFNVRNIRQEAGTAVANGLPWQDALRAITVGPATLFGVADQVGALRPGSEANVVVWSGDPFELSTRAEHVFVRGREYAEPTREDLLTARYRQLPPR